MTESVDRFGEPVGSPRPEGFRYRPQLVSRESEATLLIEIQQLPLRDFPFHGWLGKRRVACYGWKYDYDARAIVRADPIPSFLIELREAASRFAGVPAEALQQALVTEYGSGGGIGWHRDKPRFGEIVGVSLLSPCVFRLRRRTEFGWQRASITAEPRSAYVMSGPSRTDWEHSIPPVEELRYAVTFRSLRTTAIALARTAVSTT